MVFPCCQMLGDYSYLLQLNGGIAVEIPEPKTSILIIEDEAGVLNVLEAYLKREGYAVSSSRDGRQGLELFYREKPDLILLDLMLPGISGEDIARKVRQASSIPIIMLTAKGEEEERLEGLGLGADDYLVKPVSPREVVARVKTVLRRLEISSGRVQQNIIECGGLTINTFSRKVYWHGGEIELTRTEYEILEVLVTYPGKVFSRENLAGNIFGYLWEGEPRTIDVHVKNLRRKIEPEPKNPSYVKTVFGSGYRFDLSSPGEEER